MFLFLSSISSWIHLEWSRNYTFSSWSATTAVWLQHGLLWLPVEDPSYHQSCKSRKKSKQMHTKWQCQLFVIVNCGHNSSKPPGRCVLPGRAPLRLTALPLLFGHPQGKSLEATQPKETTRSLQTIHHNIRLSKHASTWKQNRTYLSIKWCFQNASNSLLLFCQGT